MPQMMPLNWLYLYIFFLLILMIMIIMNFYIYPLNLTDKKINTFKKISYSWKL